MSILEQVDYNRDLIKLIFSKYFNRAELTCFTAKLKFILRSDMIIKYIRKKRYDEANELISIYKEENYKEHGISIDRIPKFVTTGRDEKRVMIYLYDLESIPNEIVMNEYAILDTCYVLLDNHKGFGCIGFFKLPEFGGMRYWEFLTESVFRNDKPRYYQLLMNMRYSHEKPSTMEVIERSGPRVFKYFRKVEGVSLSDAEWNLYPGRIPVHKMRMLIKHSEDIPPIDNLLDNLELVKTLIKYHDIGKFDIRYNVASEASNEEILSLIDKGGVLVGDTIGSFFYRGEIARLKELIEIKPEIMNTDIIRYLVLWGKTSQLIDHGMIRKGQYSFYTDNKIAGRPTNIKRFDKRSRDPNKCHFITGRGTQCTRNAGNLLCTQHHSTVKKIIPQYADPIWEIITC